MQSLLLRYMAENLNSTLSNWCYCLHPGHIGGVLKYLESVYMRKLAPVRVSCWADFFISYRVYIMTRSFQISLFEGTLQVDKIHVRFKITNMHMRYLFQSTRRLILHRNLWSFRVYMILLRDLVRSEILAPVQQPGWTYARVTHAGMTCCGGIM